MKKCIIVIAISCCFGLLAKAQDSITSNPDSANIIIADIEHFWQAFDLLKNQHTLADSAKIIKNIFVTPASEGLKQYMQAAGCNEMTYVETIRKRKADYLAVRAKTESIAGEKAMMLKYLKKFKQLYPALKIPAICFTIGKFEVGGTQFENTLYIGCEVDVINHVDIITQSIHELAHFQQKTQNPTTNVEQAMTEGGAEFICYQVTGKRTIMKTWVYGATHEAVLWNEFKPKLDSTVDMRWFWDSPDKDKNRPGSLAYFIGFKICEAYLKVHQDKELALRMICEMENPKEIFIRSLYSQIITKAN